jgi:hypothetical protein
MFPQNEVGDGYCVTVRCAEMHEKKQSPKLDFGAEEAEVGLAATKYLRCSPL